MLGLRAYEGGKFVIDLMMNGVPKSLEVRLHETQVVIWQGETRLGTIQPAEFRIQLAAMLAALREQERIRLERVERVIGGVE